jgi:hypothetical protein
VADESAEGDGRPSESEAARYVPPSVIPPSMNPGRVDSVPVRLAREIDPRQQTTRRILIFRRWWLRYRRGIRLTAALSAAVLVVLVWLLLRAAPPAPAPVVAEPAVQSDSTRAVMPSRRGPAPLPSAMTVPSAANRAPQPATPPAERVPAKNRSAREVWLE